MASSEIGATTVLKVKEGVVHVPDQSWHHALSQNDLVISATFNDDIDTSLFLSNSKMKFIINETSFD